MTFSFNFKNIYHVKGALFITSPPSESLPGEALPRSIFLVKIFRACGFMSYLAVVSKLGFNFKNIKHIKRIHFPLIACMLKLKLDAKFLNNARTIFQLQYIFKKFKCNQIRKAKIYNTSLTT